MLSSILSWIFIWGSASSFGASCPEANLRVRSSHVPVYVLSNGVAASETLEDNELLLKHKSVITIPPEYVACSKDGTTIDYRRSLMRWSNRAKDLNQTQYADFADKQENTDVFFPIKIKHAEGGKLPDQTPYLNLITLFNNGFLVAGERTPDKEQAEPIKNDNRYRFYATDLYAYECYVVMVAGKEVTQCDWHLVKAQASPVNINDDSKNHGKLETENLECDQGGKNICEDIKPVMPRLTRDFMGKYQQRQGTDPLDTFVESHLSLAVWQQTQTGIQASQFLAQLMHETGKGYSRMYQLYNAAAGVSCGNIPMKNVTINVDFFGNKFNIMNASCLVRRPVNEGGHYFSYASLEEGILHWGQNYINDGSPYPTIREASKKSKAGGAYGVNPMLNRSGGQCSATPALVAALQKYARDGNYANTITRTMCEIEDKYNLTNHPCQVCLQKQWERKVKGTGAGVIK